MAGNSRRTFELPQPKKSQNQAVQLQICTEPKPNKPSPGRKVPVVYYLCRNGQLEHPHFVEVPLSSPDGLYLKDVIRRLNSLRGKGMADMYSWSSKRSYRNGFVWQDLSENDYIHPSHGHEYILKGSELLDTSLSFRSWETASPVNQPEDKSSGENGRSPVTAGRNNKSSSSFDSREYQVYKTRVPAGDIAGKLAADASTQTVDERRRIIAVAEAGDRDVSGNGATELSREEISPPSSSSSTETLESVNRSGDADVRHRSIEIDHHGSGRMKVSTALMQLITCGSMEVKDCGPMDGRDGGCGIKVHNGRPSHDAQYHI